MQRKPSWRTLSKRLVKRLPGAVRFQGGAIKNKRITIDAFYGGPPPTVDDISITIDGVVIRVRVNTHALPTPEKGPHGSTVAFTGVHPGASIAVDVPGGRRRGGICAVFARASDPTTPTHFVTCGHLFPPGASATKVIAARNSNHAEVSVGTLVVNLLGSSTKPLDVALVALTVEGVNLARRGGGVSLEDVLPANSIFNLDVHTWRPTLGGFSSQTQTASTTTNAHIDSSLWPNGFDVTDVIATTGSVSIPGDSGTILAIDPQSTTDVVNAIGSCSASDGGQSLFEPLDRAIARFASTVQLTLWRMP
jgi:hypothetical protein